MCSAQVHCVPSVRDTEVHMRESGGWRIVQYDIMMAE